MPMDHFSSSTRLKRVTAWMFRFINNCRDPSKRQSVSYLTTEELIAAETYWLLLSQSEHFAAEIEDIKKKCLPNTSGLLTLHPFLGSSGLLRVGGRVQNSSLSYSSQHPIVIYSKHPITRLIISSEHIHLLHAGPTPLAFSLGTRFHIVGGHKTVRSITRKCVVCRRSSI